MTAATYGDGNALIEKQVRTLLGQSAEIRKAAKRIGHACALYEFVLTQVRGGDVLREERAALTASSDALNRARLAMGPLLAYSPSQGLRVPVFPPVDVRDAFSALTEVWELVEREKVILGTGQGRPAEPIPRALARNIIQILTNASVARSRHRKVIQACFDLMGLGDKAEGAFKAARKVEKTSTARPGIDSTGSA